MTIQEQAVADVLAERARQDAKWGEQNHAPETYLTILMEEVGEASECALHRRFGGPEAVNYRRELVQVAAVALAMIECDDRREEITPAENVPIGKCRKCGVPVYTAEGFCGVCGK